MQRSRNLPDFEQLSVLVATVLLAYATSRFVNLPPRIWPLQILGVLLPIPINANTIIVIILAALAATGTDWLLRSHPRLGKENTRSHWLLPSMTALVIAVPLNSLPLGFIWWAGFFTGGILLVLTLLAEYITVDPEDTRFLPAAAGLTALSYALFLILTITLGSIKPRLYIVLPPIGLAAALVSLRAIHLRLNEWQWPQALAAGLIASQLAAALHYLPVAPIAYGLILLGPVYAITSFTINHSQGQSIRQAAIEPGIVVILLWVIALVFA
ncbi:MAG: hypothetical protein DWQ07_00810 [Chloroflexi bacterium]|nr:MAG: hypothetical protein DWQ07_00810 [Chloroflexota bacterium]MBL1195873.1 hypothetical protein [Chloroflexota bacterium]NOH13165.1 hypothetical protein [Chloroflexota bacterium]